MNKKGSENKLIFTISVTLLALLIGIIFLRVAIGVLDDTTYWRNFHARELGLTLDAGITGRGIMEINYNVLQPDPIFSENPTPLVAKVSPYLVEIIESGSESIKNNFRFAIDENIPFTSNQQLSSFLKIYFSKDEVRVGTSGEAVVCPDFATNKPKNEVNIFVEGPNKNQLENWLKGDGFTITRTPIDADLTLIAEENQDDKLSIYYNENQRETIKLSCLIGTKTNLDYQTIQLNENHEYYEDLNYADLNLLILTNNFESETWLKIVEAIGEYYE